MSFWGLVVHPNKSYTQTVDTPFRVTMACLGESPSNGRHSLMVTVDGETYVLCNLALNKTEQQQLDLVFDEGEEITIKMTGDSPIHLTGTYLPEDEGPDYDMDDMDDEEIDSDEADFLDMDDDDDEEDEEEDSDEEDVEPIPAGKLKELGDDDDDEEEDSDEEEDESAEEEAPKPAAKKQQDAKRKADAATPQPDAKKAKTEAGAASAKATPAAAQANGTKPAPAAKATPATEKKPAAPAAAEKATPAAKAADSKAAASAKSTPAASASGDDKTPKKKVLPSGLALEDKVVGSGAKAKKGKTLGVRYIGKLANGKVFDSNTQGAPFKLQLGKGSVIKGWEVGLEGMNAGGTRVLTIPPNLAYGAKGAPPDIPPNSTLTFEIKLLTVD